MRKYVLFALMASLVVLLGCGSQEEPAQTKKPVTAQKVKQETKEAAEALKEYTLQQKEAYQKKLGTKLKEMQQKIADLKARAAKATPEAKAKLQENEAELQKKWDAAQKKFDELQKSSGQAWGELKSGTDAAMNDLEKAYNKAVSHFK
jgi:CHASE3 domain sensor protein